MGKLDHALMGASKDGRTRNWCFIVYPESAPDGWENKLDETCIEWARSPLHDKDIDPTLEPKKPHYHCVLCFQSVKSYEQVCSILKSVMGDGFVRPFICQSLRGYVRYFMHLDNPDKVQYDIKDCRFCGGDYYSYVAPTTSEKDQFIKEMCQWCIDNDIVELSDLADYAMYNNLDWFHILSNCATLYMNAYLRSRRHKVTKPLI